MSLLGIYLVIAGILVIVYITLSIVLFVKIDGFNQAFNKQINNQQSMFSDELQQIDTDLIADIQIVIGNQNCPDGYSDSLFQYVYYGTQQGCQCYASYQLGIIKESCCKQGESDTGYYKTEYYEEYNSATEQYETKSKQVYVPPDCTCYGEEIESIEQKILKKFQMYNQNSNQYENIKGCLKYLDGYTFKTKSPLLDEDNNLYCQDQNDKPCGNKNNGICFPKTIGCPIVNIYFSDFFPSSQYDGEDDVMEYVISSNFQTKAYIQRMSEDDENPLTQFYVTEGDGVCSGIRNNFSPNRESYILEIQQRNMCQNIDSGFRTATIEIGEIDFFEINDSNYYDRLQDLPQWVDFDNSYEYQLYQSDIQGMVIYCRQFYDLYDGFKQIIIDIKSRVSNISSALIGFGILYLILNPIQLFLGILVLDKQVCIGMSFNIFLMLIKIAIFQPVFWTYHANYYKELQNLDQYFTIVNSDYDCPGKDELFNIFKSLDDDIQNKLNFLKVYFIYLNIFSPEGLFCGGLIIIVLITLIYVTLDQISQIGCDKCLKKMCYIFTCCFCGYGIYKNIQRKKEKKREKQKQQKIKDAMALSQQLDKKQKNGIKIDMNRRYSYQYTKKDQQQLQRRGSSSIISINQNQEELSAKNKEDKVQHKNKIRQKQQKSINQHMKGNFGEHNLEQISQIGCDKCLKKMCYIFTCCFCGYGIYKNIYRKKEKKREQQKQQKIKDAMVLQEQLDKKQKNEIKIYMNRRYSYQYTKNDQQQLSRQGSSRAISINQNQEELSAKNKEDKVQHKNKIQQKQQKSINQHMKGNFVEQKKSSRNTIIINDQSEINCTIPYNGKIKNYQNSKEKIISVEKAQPIKIQIKSGSQTNLDNCYNKSPNQNKLARYKRSDQSYHIEEEQEEEEEKVENKENFLNIAIKQNNNTVQNQIYIYNDNQKNNTKKKMNVNNNQGDNASMESFKSSQTSSSSYESSSLDNNSYTINKFEEKQYNKEKHQQNEDIQKQIQNYLSQEIKNEKLEIKKGKKRQSQLNDNDSDSESDTDSEFQNSFQQSSQYLSQQNNYYDEQLQNSLNSYQNKSMEIQKPQNPFALKNMGSQNIQEKNEEKEKVVNQKQKIINPYYSKIKNKNKKLQNQKLNEQMWDKQEQYGNIKFGIFEPNIIAQNQIMKSQLNYNYPEEE